MVTSIRVRTNYNLANRLKRDIKRIESELKKTGKQVEDEIVERTLSGRDVNERKFVPYSEGYKKFKIRQGLYAGHPDIHLTGETLEGITSRVRRNGDVKLFLEIDIVGANAKKKAQWVSAIRKFFGLSKKQKTQIRVIFNNIFRRK